MKLNSLLCILVAAVLASCGGNERRQAAAGLVEQARLLTENHQYDSALVVLDTLNVKYRDCLDERREGTRIRLEALSSLTRDSLAAAELQLRAVTARVDTLAPLFKKVEIEGTEGYYVDKNVYSGTEMNSNGIQVRVDDQGYCFVIANVEGRRLGLKSLSYNGISTPDVKCVEVEGSEIMSVTQEAAAPFLDALCEAQGKAEINLVGTKGNVKVSLASKQLDAVRSTWEYARALQLKRTLDIRLEKLERQLARLSDQLASQIPVTEENE